MDCKNCGYSLRLTDLYCPKCGQGVAESRDRGIAQLLRSVFVEMTSLDGRLLRSVHALLLKPGFLAREFRDGRRRQYLTPIGLFLLGNLLYFLAPPLSDLQLSLSDQYELQPYRAWIAGWVDHYIAASGETFEQVARRYELRIAELAKLMVILHVPLLALATLALFPDRRLFYADHLVVGLQYFAFFMIYLITMSAILGLVYWLAPEVVRPVAPMLAPFVILGQFLYVPPMLKRAMDVSWWRATLTTPLFVLGLFIAHMTYRLLQFVVGFSLVSMG